VAGNYHREEEVVGVLAVIEVQYLVNPQVVDPLPKQLFYVLFLQVIM
jgi:hypothetical protein